MALVTKHRETVHEPVAAPVVARGVTRAMARDAEAIKRAFTR